jgi:hypothetical protein
MLGLQRARASEAQPILLISLLPVARCCGCGACWSNTLITWWYGLMMLVPLFSPTKTTMAFLLPLNVMAVHRQGWCKSNEVHRGSGYGMSIAFDSKAKLTKLQLANWQETSRVIELPKRMNHGAKWTKSENTFQIFKFHKHIVFLRTPARLVRSPEFFVRSSTDARTHRQTQRNTHTALQGKDNNEWKENDWIELTSFSQQNTTASFIFCLG